MPSASSCAAVGVRRDRHRLLGKHQRAEPAHAARAQRCRCRVEGDTVVALFDLRRRTALRSRRALIGAASTMRLAAAAPVISATARNGSRASGDAGSTLPPRPLASRKAALAAAAIFRDAVGIGQSASRRAGCVSSPSFAALAAGRLQPTASPSRAHPPRGASGRGGNCRAGGARSTSSPPSPRSVSTAAMLGGQFAGALGRGIDHHARKPRRQRQRAQLAAFVGDAAVGVDGAAARQASAFASLQARRAAADRETQACRDRSRPTAPGRARTTTDRPTEFPAAYRARAKPVCGSSHSR